MNQPADTNDLPVRVRRAAWLARAAFLLVFAINVQCAASFVLWPDAYAPSFEVAGVPGAAAVQGLGIAFLMWNATSPAVIASPLRFRAVAVIVLAQQAYRGCASGCPPATPRFPPASSASSCSTPQASC